MLRSRVRAAAARRWPLRALLALALPAVMAGMLLGPASPAHAVGTVLYVPNTFANTVSVVDTSSDTITATIPVGQWPYYTAVTPDGSQVFVPNYRSDTVSVISAATDTVTATIPVSSGPKGVVVDAAGKYAYVAGSGGLTQISTATDTVTGTVAVGDSPQTLAVSPDGSTVYVGGYVGAVSVVNTATMTVRAVFGGQGGNTWSMAISPDGNYLYMADSVGLNPINANVTVISTATDKIVAHVPVGGLGDILGGIAVTPDGSAVYVSDEMRDTVSVISTATNTVTGTIKGFNAPTGVAINSAGTTVWVGNMGNTTVSVVDPVTNTITGSISGFPGGSWGLSESTSYYDFIGFDAPLGPQPEINQANAGQAIPIQFTLVGDPGTGIFNAGYPATQQVNCSTGVPVNSSTISDAATAGASGLQDDSGSYTFVWKTSKAWAGTCQEFILGLNDGSTHTATFQFK